MERTHWTQEFPRFTLDAFDTSGNYVAHIIGVIAAKRVTVDTTSIF
jgi:hypothetical protein